jgi:cellulose biosynthesis protein BcsQ
VETNKNATRASAQRVTIFSHKGGVGKTTLTVNIAAALADQNKRILLVDSDPQCNLTSYLVEENVVDGMLDESDGPKGVTLWSALKPVAEGVGGINVVQPLERLRNVYLLPGDIRLSEFEQELTTFWSDCYQRKPKGFRGATALSLLVNEIAEAYSIDYVFYDAGPNIGPLNRVVLLDCDSFIIPAGCDLFSIRALKTLGHTLVKWIREWETIVELAPDNMYLLPGTPAFIGYIPQRFRVYGAKPALDYAKYLPRIEKQIQSDIVALLGAIDPALVVAPTQLGQIKDFGSLAAASQREGLPIYNTSTANADQRSEAHTSFESVAKKIIERTGG